MTKSINGTFNTYSIMLISVSNREGSNIRLTVIAPSLPQRGFTDSSFLFYHIITRYGVHLFFYLVNAMRFRNNLAPSYLSVLIHIHPFLLSLILFYHQALYPTCQPNHYEVTSLQPICRPDTLFTCLNKKELNRLQTVQNAAARLLTHTQKREHITPVLASLHWLPVHFRINFKILVLTFRALHGQAPPYISDLIIHHVPACTMRSSGQRLLEVPYTHFKTSGDRSVQAVAPILCNALPLSLRCSDSFRKQLKTFS